jgi:hypothetical protein
MSQQELLRTVVQALDRAEIEYMLTGSMVSSLQGEPRSTHDIDLIISIQESDVETFLAFFPAEDYYTDEVSIQKAVARQSMFNILDLKGGTKVDFWILKDDPFDRSRFARRYVEKVFGVDVRVSRPEDTILAKLRWARESGGSEKQFTDALRVFEVQYQTLDLGYIDRWARELQLEDLWRSLRQEAEVVE